MMRRAMQVRLRHHLRGSRAAKTACLSCQGAVSRWHPAQGVWSFEIHCCMVYMCAARV